jgi:hypothetical protein
VILPGINYFMDKEFTGGTGFRRDFPSHGGVIHRKNDYSAENYYLSDELSTEGMGFRLKLPVHRRGIHKMNGIPPGITS